MNTKILAVFAGILIMVISALSVVAHEDDNLSEAAHGKELIDSGIACDKLSADQLELMGEYYMDQMHPGNEHELMNDIMKAKLGESGEEQMHVNMAKAIYCKDKSAADTIMSSGIMGNSGMKNSAMMGSSGNMMGGGYFGSGMSSNWWVITNTLGFLLLLGSVLLVWIWIWKSWHGAHH